VICLTQVVGLILVIALVSLPAATAAHHVTRMTSLCLVSTLLCVILATLPRIAVYGTRIDPQSAIVLSAAAAYLLSVLGRRCAGRCGRQEPR
jgi:zinc transport system permease protein